MANINLSKIGWQNGTLVSKAKVEIGGTIYEVEPEEYSGATPLSAENLIQMEENTEDGINEIIARLNGTVLYSNNAGTRDDTITFTGGSISEGELIEILYGRVRVGDGSLALKTTGKLSYFSGMVISLDMLYNSAGGMETSTKRIIVGSTGITTENKNNDNLAIKEIRKFVY